MRDSSTSPPPSISLIFAGGGTGGHLYPGLAIAELFRHRLPESRLLFVGSTRAIEQQIVEQQHFPHAPLPFRSPRAAWKHPWRFWNEYRNSLQSAQQLLTQTHADLVIGLGGFASYPLLKAARQSRTPFLLLEQNVVPGRVTRFYARSAQLVCGSYAATQRYLPRKTNFQLTGNPVRQEVLACLQTNPQQTDQQRSATPTLLITGGSQGSDRLNHWITQLPKTFWALLAESGWRIRHQTGQQTPQRLTALQDFYASQHLISEVAPYFPQPATLYHDVELVISRAGGTTLAELASLQLPALIIPLANAARNHQHHNALHHLQTNPGILLTEKQAQTPEILTQALTTLLSNHPPRNTISADMFAIHAQAAEAIYQHVLNIARPR